jgi:monovalent cation/proton antiporter MnhG/PhaG subunit
VSAQDAVVALLLAVGVGVELLCCIGVLVMRDVFDRLHYTGLASSLGPAALAAAIVIAESFSWAGIKALLIAALLWVTNAVLTHATGRAAHVRRYGRWQLSPKGKDERP